GPDAARPDADCPGCGRARRLTPSCCARSGVGAGSVMFSLSVLLCRLARPESPMSNARRAFVVLTSAIVLSVAAIGAAPAPAPEQTTRTVYVTVVDNDGQPVAGLTPADFRLRENNRDREIASVEPATEPMRIALMVEETLTPAGSVRQGLF